MLITLNNKKIYLHKLPNNSEFHVEWEEGPCNSMNDNGEPIEYDNVWHRHPFGTEYAELWKNN